MSNYIERTIRGNNIFFFKNGIKITNTKIINKCKSIYIPPAYTDVKIFLGQKLLATGYDKAHRKQYVYSVAMKELREKKKLKQLKKIGVHIDKLHSKLNKDLSQHGFSKNKLTALVLKIIELCNFRCGSKNNEKKYGSYGITTIHKKHVSFKKEGVIIDFIGKKGVQNTCIIEEPLIQKLIKEVYDKSSSNNKYLFSIKEKNEIIQVSKEDVNQYLEKFDITSKDLRTWNANIIFLTNLKKELEKVDNVRNMRNKTNKQKLMIRKGMIRESIKQTAFLLHNTPAICKSSYIYKNIIQIMENSNNIATIFKNSNMEINLKHFLEK